MHLSRPAHDRLGLVGVRKIFGSGDRGLVAGQVVGPGIYRGAAGADVVLVEVGYLPASTGKLVEIASS